MPIRRSGVARAVTSVAPGGSGLTSYSTNFDLTEDPISEGGVWSRIDTLSTAFQSGNGRAWGKQSGSNGYDDSQATIYAITNPNVRAEAIIYKDAAIGAENHEIEICLRTVEGTTWTKKYE